MPKRRSPYSAPRILRLQAAGRSGPAGRPARRRERRGPRPPRAGLGYLRRAPWTAVRAPPGPREAGAGGGEVGLRGGGGAAVGFVGLFAARRGEGGLLQARGGASTLT